MPVCADMARVLKPSFCPLSSFFAAQSEAKGCRDYAQFLAWEQPPGKDQGLPVLRRTPMNGAQPFGAVGRSIQCAARGDDVLSFVALGAVSDFLPRLPQIINQQG